MEGIYVDISVPIVELTQEERDRIAKVIAAVYQQEQRESPTERLIAKIDRVMDLIERNERDRELSTVWKWGDGRMMTRAEYEAQDRNDVRFGYTRKPGFNVEPERS